MCRLVNLNSVSSKLNTNIYANGNKAQVGSAKNFSDMSFQGLNRTLSKKAYSTIQILDKNGLKKEISAAEVIKQEAARFPKSMGIVGNLPKEWIDRIPQKNRAVKIKNLYNEIKLAVNDYRFKFDSSDTSNPNVLKDLFVDVGIKLNVALKNAGIVKKNKVIDFEKIDHGCRGVGFRIQNFSANDYMMKIFYSNDFIDEKLCNGHGLSDGHGNYTELNRASFVPSSKSQWIGLKFGDIGSGYLVEKMISDKMPKNKRYVPEKLYGLENRDPSELNGYYYDYGGLYVVDKTLAQNKTARFVYKKMYYEKEQERADMALKFLGMKKYRNNKDVKLGLACSIDLFPEQQRTMFYKNLLNNADEVLKNELQGRIRSLPEKDRSLFMPQFMRGKSKEELARLSDFI